MWVTTNGRIYMNSVQYFWWNGVQICCTDRLLHILTSSQKYVRVSVILAWGKAYKDLLDMGIPFEFNHAVLDKVPTHVWESILKSEVTTMESLLRQEKDDRGVNENVAHDATKQETVNAIRSHLQTINKLIEKL